MSWDEDDKPTTSSIQLTVSRRQSQDIRARAAYLNRSPGGYLVEVIRAGLKALPRPLHYDEPADDDDRFGQSRRHGAQGEPATGPCLLHETPAAPSPSLDEDTTP